MKGQLHTHTPYSDGHITKGQILGSGLDFVAITDHDTIDGINGYLFKCGDINDLVVKMRMALQNIDDPEIQQKAKETVKVMFDAKRQSERIFNNYSKILS